MAAFYKKTWQHYQNLLFFADMFLFPEESLEHAPRSGPVALGGDYSPEILLQAYQKGIFPWGKQRGKTAWFCPDPRCVLFPQQIVIHRNMHSLFKKNIFSFSADQAFSEVIRSCREVRESSGEETWIDDALIAGFEDLHRLGWAHSIEVWQDNDLAGGLYGVSIGKVFYGESMFFRKSNASKAALIALCRFLHDAGYLLVDCQVPNEHLISMGCVLIPRTVFLKLNKKGTEEKGFPRQWTFPFSEWLKKQQGLQTKPPGK